MLLVLASAVPVGAAEGQGSDEKAAAARHGAEALSLVDVAYGGHRWRERDLRAALERALRESWPGTIVRRREFARAARRAGVRRDEWLSTAGLPRIASRIPLDLAVTAEAVGRGERRRLILEATDGSTGEVRARVTQPMPRGKLAAGEATAAIESLLTAIDAAGPAAEEEEEEDFEADAEEGEADDSLFASDALDFDDAEEIDEATEAFVDFEARVAAQHHSYLYDDDLEPTARNGIEAGLRVHGGVPQAAATLSVIVRHDFSDDARNRIDVDETFVDVGPAWLSLRGGRLLETWGAASLYNPTDLLNPRDLRDPLDAEKLGVWALRLRSVIGPVALEGYFLPVPEADLLPPITGLDGRGLPTSTSRWFRPFSAPLPGLLVTNLVAEGAPEAKPQNFQGAFRAGLSVAGIDMTVGYAYLFDRMPTLRLEPLTLPVPPAPTVILASLEHHRAHVGMAEIQRALGGLRLAAEGVLMARDIDDEQGIDGSAPYVIAVAGADYRVAQVADIHDFHFFLDLLTTQAFDGDLPTDPIGRTRYLARYGALGRVRYELDGKFFVQTSAFTNLEAYEVYFRPAAGYRFFERVTLELGADLFFGAPETVMGSYHRNQRITFEMVGEI